MARKYSRRSIPRAPQPVAYKPLSYAEACREAQAAWDAQAPTPQAPKRAQAPKPAHLSAAPAARMSDREAFSIWK